MHIYAVIVIYHRLTYYYVCILLRKNFVIKKKKGMRLNLKTFNCKDPALVYVLLTFSPTTKL